MLPAVSFIAVRHGAPLPVASGQSSRHRLDRRGNRQLNAVLHRIALTQLRMYAPAHAFVARKPAEGKSTREALPQATPGADRLARAAQRRGQA